MIRSSSELIRVKEQIDRLRVVLDSIEVGLKDGPIGLDEGQPVLQAAGVFAATLARLGAYQLAEDDARGAVCDWCKDTHVVNFDTEDGPVSRPCLQCPVPCQKCRVGGHGSYCTRPRCRCDCHKKGRER